MSLDFPILNMGVPLIDRAGKPNAQLNLLWAKLKRSLENADAAQEQTIAQLQQQQALLVQVIGVLADNVLYLSELGEWLIALGQFSSQRIAYLQSAVAGIATQIGYDLPDPSGLPDYPGPPPMPPWDEP